MVGIIKKLIKSYFIPNLIKINKTEARVILKTNELRSFNFSDFQLLNIMKVLAGATTLYLFQKFYFANEMKAFFHASVLYSQQGR